MNRPRSGPWKRPREISDVIGRVRPRLAPQTLLARVQERWLEAVGEKVAEQSSPVSERAGTVTVSCRSSTWAAELEMLGPSLLEELNRALPEGLEVRRLKFRAEPL